MCEMDILNPWPLAPHEYSTVYIFTLVSRAQISNLKLSKVDMFPNQFWYLEIILSMDYHYGVALEP